MAKAVPVAPDHACKATEQSDDEDDDQDCAKRHVIFFPSESGDARQTNGKTASLGCVGSTSHSWIWSTGIQN
jgi:hypothetical protein